MEMKGVTLAWISNLLEISLNDDLLNDSIKIS